MWFHLNHRLPQPLYIPISNLLNNQIPALRIRIQANRRNQYDTDHDILPERVHPHHVKAGGYPCDGHHADQGPEAVSYTHLTARQNRR